MRNSTGTPSDTGGILFFSTKVRTVFWLLLMVALWGLSWPATKIALATVPPLWLATARFCSSAICLFVFLHFRRMLRFPSKGDWPIVASVGLLQMMTFTGLGMIAMTYTDTSRAVVIAYTTPLWAVLMTWLILKKAPTGQQAFALVIGVMGIALICSPMEMHWEQPGALMGSIFLLVGAICWSVVILHVRNHNWTAAPVSLAPWQMLLATIPLSMFAYLFEGSPLEVPLDTHLIWLLLFIGPVATSACFVIAAEYGRRISVFAMSNFTLGVPVVGIVSSVVILGNHLSPAFLFGLVLIGSGMALAARASRC